MSSALIQQCPACSRIIQFADERTTLLQCDCGHVIERRSEALRIVKLALTSQPISIIQPGTEGIWEKSRFKVLGGFRTWMDKAVFNYWTIQFDDNTLGYLSEGYGLFAIHTITQIKHGLNSEILEKAKTGYDTYVFDEESFLLIYNNKSYKCEIEGEVYLPEALPWFQILEFAHPNGKNLKAIAVGNTIDIWNEFYVPLISLELKNTRNWTPSTKEFTCTTCLQKIEIKSFPYSQSCACSYCHSSFVMQDNGEFTLYKPSSGSHATPAITLGAIAVIKDIKYEVVGYTLKEELNTYHSQWKEYVLFNSKEGFAFLSEYNGHWIYARQRGNTPVLRSQTIEEFVYDEQLFQIFNRYDFKIVTAEGEFPFSLCDDEKLIQEFISPPVVWIQETHSADGINWYWGEHISREELKVAFGETLSLPPHFGVGAVEPKKIASESKIAIAALISIAVLLFSHIASTWALENRILVNTSYTFDSASSISYVFPALKLDKWRSNLQFDVEAPVDNSWFELNATLVNTQTGTEYNLEQGVEYYDGYSEGEYWSEGSKSETAYLNQIPRGTYNLQISGTRDWIMAGSSFTKNRPDGFSVVVTYDALNNRNLIFCLLGLVILPLINFLQVKNHEKNRWSNSPFSSYEN